MIPRFRPLVGLAELRALARPSRGDVAEYERAFAATVGARHAIAFGYGRTALKLLLEAEGLREREVICPAYTCVVVPHAIVLSGNRPVFVDCAADGNMDLKLAEARITPRTAAIIPTSIFGHSVDLDRLERIRQRHPRLLVIQDCAHSFSCEWSGRPVQSAGAAAIYGSNISKVATSIFGGMATTDDDGLAGRLRKLRDRRVTPASAGKCWRRALYLCAAAAAFHPTLYGLTDAVRRTGALRGLEEYYDEQTIDLPVDHLQALTPVEGRVGSVQIRRLSEFVAARRRYAAFYRERLAALAGLRFLPAPDGSSFSHIAALVAEPLLAVSAARRRGVELGRVIDYCVPDMPSYAPFASGGPWPLASRYAAHVINLPLWGRFELHVADRVSEVMCDVLRGAAEPPLAG